MRFKDRSRRIDHFNRLYVFHCVAGTIAHRPSSNNRVGIVANHIHLLLHELDVHGIAVVDRGQDHSSWNGTALHRFVCWKGFDEVRSLRVGHHNGELVVRAVATLVSGCQRNEVLVVVTIILTNDLTAFGDGNGTAVVSCCRRVRLLLTLVGLVHWHFGEDRSRCILNLNRLDMLRRITGAITHRPRAHNRVGLRASSIRNGLIEHYLDCIVTVVSGRQYIRRWNGIAFNRFIRWQGFDECRSLSVSHDNGKLVIRAVAAFVGSGQRNEVLVVATLVFADDVAVFSDGHRAAVIRSRRRVRLLFALARLIHWHLREYRSRGVLNLNGLNVFRDVSGAIAHRPRAYNRIGLRACSVRNGLVEHYLDGRVAVVYGSQNISCRNGIALNDFIRRQCLNKHRCRRILNSNHLGVAGCISSAISSCPRAQDFVLAVAIGSIDGFSVVAVFDRFICRLAVICCSQVA